MAGYIVLGIGFGILLRDAGYGVAWAFAMTALFLASFTEQWLTTRNHIPALTGLLSTLACLLVFGQERFLIPAMLLITLALTLLRGRVRKEAPQ
ncbi:MAG: hypothetical protein IKN81_03590 [Oscillospiraceae bacterium]|nr:hypothetical protein [Oscillospiraceae bacterium]